MHAITWSKYLSYSVYVKYYATQNEKVVSPGFPPLFDTTTSFDSYVHYLCYR